MSGSTSDQLALALGPYDNRKLFSDHFLSERLPAWPQFAAADPASLLRDRERDGRAPRRPGSASARTCAAATAPGAARPRDGGDDLIAEFEGTTPAFIRELLRRSALVAPSRPTGRCASRSATLRETHAELCAGPAS